MDRLDAMRLFVRVMERRSFTQAAHDSGVSRSTVTEAIQQLEARLGVRLLQRTTRTVRPTLDGEAYYRRSLGDLCDPEPEAQTGEVALRAGQLSLRVRVFLDWAAHEFAARNPRLEGR